MGTTYWSVSPWFIIEPQPRSLEDGACEHGKTYW